MAKNETLNGRFQHPMYTAATLTAKNPVLLAGEVVYESDTGRHKIGDGIKAWNALLYAGGGLRAIFRAIATVLFPAIRIYYPLQKMSIFLLIF